jgi:hypothetical protein
LSRKLATVAFAIGAIAPLAAAAAQNIHPTPPPDVRAVALQGQLRIDAAPRSRQRLVYGEDVETWVAGPRVEPTGDTTFSCSSPLQPGGPSQEPRTICIDPDGGGAADTIAIADPGFTFRSLRGNAVLRWEYLPGSTLFVVWTRTASSSLSRGAIDFGSDARALFEGPAENIFLVKVNYRLGF